MNYHYKDENVFVQIKKSPPRATKMIARADVTLRIYDSEYVRIRGFILWHSKVLNNRLQQHINIKPPSTSEKGKWTETVHFLNKNSWENLEMIIYSAYLEFQKRGEDTGIQDIDPDDLPI